MDLQLGGKIAVVTGAASGIGRATAELLAAEGASVGCIDVQAGPLEEVAAAIRSAGGKALAAPLDLLETGRVKPEIDGLVGRLGGLDVLVNAAGVGGFVKTLECSLEAWNRTIGINLTGTFLVCQAALPHLLARGKGSIVNISSIAGLKGQPFAAGYNASKGGVSMLTRGLAIEFAKQGIRVNAVCPGGIRTAILAGFNPKGLDESLLATLRTPGGNFGEPEDVARTIAFLASDLASYLSGVTLPIDGATLA